MVHNKRKKNSRQRGSWTHGWGEKKKHRGAGHRGGRGLAGTGKKGDAKKTKHWKDTKYFGKHGFHSITATKTNTINLSTIVQHTQKWVTAGKATNEAGTIKINLTELGYDKLLGTGNTKQKLEITIETASQKAIEKIEKTGGKVNLPAEKTSQKEEKPVEKPKAKK